MTQITGKFLVKMVVVVGTAVTGGNLFAAFTPASQGIIFKSVSRMAGTAVGGYVGIRVANDLDEMITNAKATMEKEEGVKVNG